MKTKACLSVVTVSLLALLLTCELAAFAQDQVAQQPTTSSVPNLIRYGGVLKDADGAVLASQTLGVTFALYKQQDGGVALWTEVRNVTTDAAGQYSVMLGSTKTEGVPAELFSDHEQRFLGVQVQGQAEQARILLVSVPYAFKAHEAETLGGLPASAFVKNPTAGAPDTAIASALSTTGNSGGAAELVSPPGGTGFVFNTPCPTPRAPAPLYVPLFFPSFGPPFPANVICDSVIRQNVLSGAANVGIGRLPLAPARLDVNGNLNVNDTRQSYMIGYKAVLTSPAHTDNLFLGVDAGGNNPANNVTGFDNTFGGFDAGLNATTGSTNTFYGSRAGQGITPGMANSGIGNTFIGYKAGLYNADGNVNTYVGEQAGNSNDRGSGNVFVGDIAGLFVAGVSSNGNTFVGHAAGGRLNSGHENTFVGDFAGHSLDTGSGNLCIGSNCADNSGGGNNNIYVASVGCSTFCPNGENATIRIGDQMGQSPSNTYIAGIYPAVVTDRQVFIQPDGRLGTMLSSRRFKEQIADIGDSSSKLLQLRPVTFLYKPEYVKGDRTLQFGLLAEEVAKIYPELVEFDKDGQPLTVKYQFLAPLLLNELQKEHTMVTAQQHEMQSLREQTKAQQQQMLAQQQQAQTQEQKLLAQQQQIESLKAQLQLQNAAFQERLSRLESLVTTQVQTAAADKPTQPTPTANGGLQ